MVLLLLLKLGFALAICQALQGSRKRVDRSVVAGRSGEIRGDWRGITLVRALKNGIRGGLLEICFYGPILMVTLLIPCLVRLSPYMQLGTPLMLALD